MSKVTFWYSVDGETRYELPTFPGTDPSDRAVDAAEDYHGNHDGWESSWPLVLTLYGSEEGPAVAKFEVERESVPHFSAREVA